MNIKTQVIDKIEDVRGGDVVVDKGGNYIFCQHGPGDYLEIDTGGCIKFDKCTVVRITIEGKEEGS